MHVLLSCLKDVGPAEDNDLLLHLLPAERMLIAKYWENIMGPINSLKKIKYGMGSSILNSPCHCSESQCRFSYQQEPP